MGIASWEALWSEFPGEGPELAALRDWMPEYRQEVWSRALQDCGLDDAALADELAMTFFRIERPDFPHPAMHHLFGLPAQYFALYEENDPAGRLLAIANYNTNLAEYWQLAGTGFFPIDPSNEAFKLGINYLVYGLTH